MTLELVVVCCVIQNQRECVFGWRVEEYGELCAALLTGYGFDCRRLGLNKVHLGQKALIHDIDRLMGGSFELNADVGLQRQIQSFFCAGGID